MSNLVCPDRAQLADFVTGKASEDFATQIIDHLQVCIDCDRTIETLGTASDTLIERLRMPTPRDVYAEEPGCRSVELIVDAMGKTLRKDQSVGPDDDLSSQMIGQYALLRKLGSGSMGTVYEAVHTKLDKSVALKVLPTTRTKDAKAIARFEREMRAVGRLDHPNIIRATDAGEFNGAHFLVMELVDGVDLSLIVNRCGPLAVANACEIIRQAAVGLQETHEHGMIHRDIKPSNLMLATRKGNVPIVKVLDMGLALLTNETVVGELTSDCQIMGTFDYMAPEQTIGSHDVDIRADVYALGATLYKLLTGKAPLERSDAKTPLQKLAAIANVTPAPVDELRPDVPIELSKLVQRMLVKQPELRVATPADVADSLGPFCCGHNLAAVLANTQDIKTPRPPLNDNFTETFDSSLAQAQVSTSESLETIPSINTLRARNPRSRRVGWGMLVATGFCAFGLLAALSVFYFQTKSGIVKIEIDDPSIEVSVIGERILINQTKSGDKLLLAPGSKQLQVTRGDLRFSTDEFELTEGGEVVLRVRIVGDEILVTNKSRNDQQIGSISLRGEPTNNRSLAINEPPGDQEAMTSAIQWVLSVGGTVSATTTNKNDGETKVTTLEQLPPNTVGLTIDLANKKAVNAFDFGLLEGVEQIERLDAYANQKMEIANASALKTIGTMTGLKRLRISLGPGANSGDVDPITRLPNLQSLWLFNEYDGNANVYSDEVLHNIAKMTQLKELHFGSWNAEFSDEGVKNLRSLVNLEMLGLWGTQITDESLAEVIQSMPRLYSLDVWNNNENVTGWFLESVAKLKLGVLNLYLTGFDTRELKHLNSHQSLKIVKILNQNKVDPEGLANINSIPNLYKLHIGSSKLTDEGLITIRSRTLTHLYLNDNPLITDAGIDAALTANPSLQDFAASGCPQITDTIVDAIINHEKLSVLNIKGTSVTKDAIERLKQAKPQLKVLDM